MENKTPADTKPFFDPVALVHTKAVEHHQIMIAISGGDDPPYPNILHLNRTPQPAHTRDHFKLLREALYGVQYASALCIAGHELTSRSIGHLQDHLFSKKNELLELHFPGNSLASQGARLLLHILRSTSNTVHTLNLLDNSMNTEEFWKFIWVFSNLPENHPLTTIWLSTRLHNYQVWGKLHYLVEKTGWKNKKIYVQTLEDIYPREFSKDKFPVARRQVNQKYKYKLFLLLLPVSFLDPWNRFSF